MLVEEQRISPWAAAWTVPVTSVETVFDHVLVVSLLLAVEDEFKIIQFKIQLLTKATLHVKELPVTQGKELFC